MKKKNSNNYILELENVSKAFPGVKALNEINFNLKKGEVHSLVGENGAGKSTLLRILAGAYKKDTGVITLEGSKVEMTDPKHAHDMGISVIYQEFNLIPNLSIAENIFMGKAPCKNSGFIDFQKLYERSEFFLKKIGMKKSAKTLVSELSVAEQQMVEIAKALSEDAKVLILDEPTSALTETEVETLMKILRNLKKRGVTCIYISHKLEEFFEITDTITLGYNKEPARLH